MDQLLSYSMVEEGIVLENDKVINVLYTEMYTDGKFGLLQVQNKNIIVERLERDLRDIRSDRDVMLEEKKLVTFEPYYKFMEITTDIFC